MHAIGCARHHARQLLGLGAVDFTPQGHHALAALHFDCSLLGGTAPQQPRTDHRCQGGVLQALGIGPQLERALDQFSVDLQLVIDLLDTSGSQGHVFGQPALHLVFYLAGKPRLFAVYLDFDTERVEHAV